ncbi:unnamed protein product [Rhodiola kirilowii]
MRLSPLTVNRIPSVPTNNCLPYQPILNYRNPSFISVSCNSDSTLAATGAPYKPGVLDDVFLNVFRAKMVEEVGWNSEKPGYDGLIEVATHLMMKTRNNTDTKDAAVRILIFVRILVALFPSWLLQLYKKLIAPLGGGQVAAVMVARVTAITCQWLMGRCTVNSVDFGNGFSWNSGVFVEKCKYLEESKCVGICINTCKLPTQAFFSDYMGVPLLMEPNFDDYSCQFKFGVAAPLPQQDSALKEPCLAICPNAIRRRDANKDALQCPKA